jgi:hypothetical protein
VRWALFLAVFPLAACPAAPPPGPAYFQRTEQMLMDAIAIGDRVPWERVLDENFVSTSEVGEVTNREQFLKDLRPLPPGLQGGIAVKELTVQEFPSFAVVRYLADEWETVFGQRLVTRYRCTNTYRRVGADWKMVAAATAVVTTDPPPQPTSNAHWDRLAGDYQLMPGGWTFHVALRDGKLVGGRDPEKLKPFVPLTQDAFVLSGSLGEWLFVTDAAGEANRIVELRKFEPLVWTRVGKPSPAH